MGEITIRQPQAGESAERAGNREIAASSRMEGALREATFGNLQEARQTAALVLSQTTLGPNAEATGALTFGWADDTAHAESLLDGLAKRFPQDTLVQSVVLPTVQAQIERYVRIPSEALSFCATPRHTN